MEIIYRRKGYPFEGFDDLADYSLAVARGTKLEISAPIYSCLRILSDDEEISFKLSYNHLMTKQFDIMEIVDYIREINMEPIAFCVTLITYDIDNNHNKTLYVISAEKGNKTTQFIKSEFGESIIIRDRYYDALPLCLNPILRMLDISDYKNDEPYKTSNTSKSLKSIVQNFFNNKF